MQKVISKYPIKIGNVLVPMGTVGEVVDVAEMRKYFPKISYKSESGQVAVKFLELNPCIVHTSQLVFNHE